MRKSNQSSISLTIKASRNCMRLSRSDISMSSISCTLAERKERVQEMLKLVQLDGFGNRKITQMSGGQKQKHLRHRTIRFWHFQRKAGTAYEKEIIISDIGGGTLYINAFIYGNRQRELCAECR